MSLEISPHREHTVRDPRNAETGYRAEYEFTVESMYAPWLVEVPIGTHTGLYRVNMVVERIPQEDAA